jgi:ketosteroid isomerase-like protein
MSKQSVDVVRHSLDAYARRDVEALRALTHVDIELDWSRSLGWLAGAYRGFDQTIRFYEGYFDAFEEIVIQADCFIHAGEHVVVPNVAHQTGRDGIRVSARSTIVFTVRDGKLARICLYQGTDEALAAVGLDR